MFAFFMVVYYQIILALVYIFFWICLICLCFDHFLSLFFCFDFLIPTSSINYNRKSVTPNDDILIKRPKSQSA
jgi:hypothetical protein